MDQLWLKNPPHQTSSNGAAVDTPWVAEQRLELAASGGPFYPHYYDLALCVLNWTILLKGYDGTGFSFYLDSLYLRDHRKNRT